MKIPNLKTVLAICISVAFLLLIAVITQYIIYDNTVEELQACQAEYEELERENEELEEKLQASEDQNEKCRKLVMILSANRILEDDDLDDY